MKRYCKLIPKYASGSDLSSIYSLAGNTAGNLIEGQNKEEYSLNGSGVNQGRMIGSNAARYAGQGAALGSMFGGIGAPIGAAVGAVAGTVIGAANYKKEQANYETWKKEKIDNLNQQGVSNYNTNLALGFKPMGNRYATFAFGGKLPKYATGGFTPEYEVEKDEMIEGDNVQLSHGKQISGNMHKAEKYTHDDINPDTGGTGVYGSGGERVFSNRSTLTAPTIQLLKALKVPTKETDTHAKVALTVAKKESKFEPKLHAISLRERNTAKQMLQRYSTVKEIIFQDQESQKQMMPQFKYGGNINKFPEGGNVLDALDVPQKKMMKQITGKEEKPSQALKRLKDASGMYNPMSNPILDKVIGLAADIVVDPLNLLPFAKYKYVKGLFGSEKALTKANGARKIYNSVVKGSKVADTASDVNDFAKGGYLNRYAVGGKINKLPKYDEGVEFINTNKTAKGYNWNNNVDYSSNTPVVQLAELKGGNNGNEGTNWGTIANTLNLVNNIASVNKLKSFNNPEMPINPITKYTSNLPYNIYENAKAGRTALKTMSRYSNNPNDKYAIAASVIEGNNKAFADDNMRRGEYNNQVSLINNQIDNQKIQIKNAVNQGRVDLNNTKITERNNAVNVWATGEMQNRYHNDQIKLEDRSRKLLYKNRYGNIQDRLFKTMDDKTLLNELKDENNNDFDYENIQKEINKRDSLKQYHK